jgi:DNA-binding LytR/AlgR family response regulator
MTGLECAQALAEDWPANGRPFPLIVFVTAYDEYALQTFERGAFDDVLKPVQPKRLAKTCARLKDRLADGYASPPDEAALGKVVDQMREMLAAGRREAPTAPVVSAPLRVIQASAGNTITMIPIDEVCYFEAADKYVRVVTANREHMIRMSLRELLQQLDSQRFCQIHRGTIVRCDAIDTAERDEAGKLTLTLCGNHARLVVSRVYTDLFKGMWPARIDEPRRSGCADSASSWLSCADQFVTPRKGDRLSAVMKIQLREHVADMRLHGALADVEHLRDPAVTGAFRPPTTSLPAATSHVRVVVLPVRFPADSHTRSRCDRPPPCAPVRVTCR